MKRRNDHLRQISYDPGIISAEMICCQCNGVGATIVAFVPDERAYYGMTCAANDGWPWISSEGKKG